MKKLKYMIFLICCLFCLASCERIVRNKIDIGYLTVSDQFTKEDSAAFNWLVENRYFEPHLVNIDEGVAELKKHDVIWIHIHDSIDYLNWEPYLSDLKPLKNIYQNGGKLFLTNFAALLPYKLCIESNKPGKIEEKIKNYWTFDKRGLQSFRGHPIFSGLFGGSFIWDALEDYKLTEIGYFDDNFPKEGKVVATEKSYIFVKEKKRLAIEYNSERGKILSIGSLIFLGKKNNLRVKMEKFLENSLLYLAGELTEGEKTYWEKFENIPKSFIVETEPIEKAEKRDLKGVQNTRLLFEKDNPKNNFYDISGRRALVMGYQNGGIDEIWVHPFRVIRDFQTGIVMKNSVVWLKDIQLKIEIRPESFTRIYQTKYGQLKEIIYTSLKKPGAIIHYEADVSEPIKLIVKMRSDLRWMWPYAENALGDIYYGYDDRLKAIHIKDLSGDFYCVIGSDIAPSDIVSGQYEDLEWKSGKFKGVSTDLNQVYVAVLYELNSENNYILNCAIVGTNEGQEKAIKDYRYLLKNPEKVYMENVNHYQDLLSTKLTIESPDEEFNNLWKWGLVGTDRFFVETPSLGAALLAGYSTTDRGWDGNHKINGRPGYGWYFGRDSEWSCFAIDDYGDFELVKKQLEFLQKFQDISGKIFHEISTSGVVHFDAADATPLYIILAAHYLRGSGDIDFIRDSWHHIKKAMDFLYSTDTDGDLLIENKNVGHGWVEGGKLWGVSTTFYLSGLWAQALKDASYIASNLDKKDISKLYMKNADMVQDILNTEFWNDSTKFYNFGKFEDGSFNPEKTVLPAVTMYYNLLDDDKVKYVLREYAGNGFSSDWGVRILSRKSRLFSSGGYHEGSVWPLFTGWTALAEYRYGNSTQGFMHIMNNLYIKNHWALGYVEEVMNGAVYKPSGVCPHQCWSETNILHPAIAGMIGWKPDAPAKSAELSPRFPWHWNKVKINNLHAGKTVLQLQMERTKISTNYEFDLSKGPKIKLHFKPEIPDGMIIQEAKLNAKTIEISPYTKRGLLAEPVSFILKDHIEITFYHHGGIGMIPLMPQPMPGESSKGYRIIDTTLEGKRYIVELQGKANTIGTFEIMIFDQSVKSVKGAQIKSLSENGVLQLEVPFHRSRQKFVSTSVIVEFD